MALYNVLQRQLDKPVLQRTSEASFAYVQGIEELGCAIRLGTSLNSSFVHEQEIRDLWHLVRLCRDIGTRALEEAASRDGGFRGVVWDIDVDLGHNSSSSPISLVTPDPGEYPLSPTPRGK